MSCDSVAELTKATKDLLYPSESDRPFEILVLSAPSDTLKAVGAALQCDPNIPTESQTVEKFFEELTFDERFAKLREVVAKCLTGVKVYRFGKSRDVVVAMIGRDADGRLICLKTISVET